MFKEISKVDKDRHIYEGTMKTGTLYKNYLFSYGTPIIVADAWVNARGPREAMNKLLAKCNLPSCKYKEDFDDNVEFGYYEVEEANYYDAEDDCTYKYYCKVVYPA